MRARQTEIGTQEFDQQGPRLDLAAHLLAVDRHADRNHCLDLPSRIVPPEPVGHVHHPGVMPSRRRFVWPEG